MNIFTKIISALSILVLLAFAFILGMATLGEGRHLIDPYVDTEFAEDYTPEKFKQVKVGMTMDEVKTIVGEPRRSDTSSLDSKNTWHHYTDDGKLYRKIDAKGRKHAGFIISDCAWYWSYITTDTNNVVVDVSSLWCYD